MVRNVGTVLLNNFSKGLITEATGLNFPDNAVTDSDNVLFEKIGRVTRRLGYDIESEAESIGYGGSATAGVVQEYMWEAVAKQGGFTFLVVQLGRVIRFFEMNTAHNISVGSVPVGIDLGDYKIPGSSPIQEIPASISAGAGYLFICHPSCDPIIVNYDSETNSFQTAKLTITIRDLEGVEDALAIDTEPVDLTIQHAYNLKNQSWYKDVRVGSANNEPGGSGGGKRPAGTSEGGIGNNISSIQPVITSPVHDSTVNSLTPTIEWDGVPMASSYIVSYGYSYMHSVGNVTTNVPRATLPRLQPNRRVFIRVVPMLFEGPGMAFGLFMGAANSADMTFYTPEG